MASAAPADLAITPRNLRFGRDEVRGRWWLGGDAVATAWHNALSASFPAGEAFFIETVRRFRDQVPAELAAQIDQFVKQEAHHTREHVAFNRQVTGAGYDIAAIDKRIADSLVQARTTHPVAQLLVTVSLEHFTAIFAHAMLARAGQQFDGASAETRAMWIWHAIEEIEHKGVAFDTYMHITRSLKPAKRWAIRSLVFFRVSRNFIANRVNDALALLAQDGITGWRAKARLWWYLVGTPGVLRQVALPWASYFRPGFHPWDHDDRALIAAHETAPTPVPA
ncbi:metal-dependent hydrolase [Sandarakinorhabdus limnophila]|uniref:metal-dependent hydrolase n=1 Tax=Sandarakinorhabdus limnophila TaxID=210512 RepID=UPI0026F0F280|nr:metal-dependent hydrolase [Sandarakinorhabdus limnophila]MCM0032784.1 metal-dependent hydrolase [Sandarakinorhabdus limnophila]